MFCTVNDCEIYYDSLDEGKPKLILHDLRYCEVQVFKVLIDKGLDRAEEELEEMN